MSDHVLTIWTLYWNPLDFPGQYVIRGHDIVWGQGDSLAPPEPVPHRDAIVGTDRSEVEARLRALRPGITWIGRNAGDELQIVGCWV